MDKYYVAIALTTVGFFALAALLLVPVWRFLRREEEISKNWTEERLAGPATESPAGDITEEEEGDRR